MGLPKFLCIGAQKAGTSWLYAQLQSHPEVWMPPVKELQFFNHLYVPEHRAWTSWHIRQGAAKALAFHVGRPEPPDFGYVRYLADLATRDPFTEDWYRRAFDRSGAHGKLVGDITPEYSTIPEQGIRHLRGLLGDRVDLQRVEKGVLEVTAFAEPREYGAHFKDYYGPTIAARANAVKNGREAEFDAALDAFSDEWNRGTADAARFEMEYLLTVGTKR